MKRWLVRLVVAGLLMAGAAYGAAVTWIFSHRSAILYGLVPGPTPIPAELRGSKVTVGKDSNALGVWDLVPTKDSSTGSARTVLYLHGTDTNLAGSAPVLSLWSARGYRVIAMDYRGYGESSGAVSADGFVDDADRVLRWMTSEQNIAPETIVVHGHSMGASIALQLAEREPKLRGVISDAGFSTAERVVNDTWGWWIPSRWLVGDDHDAFNNMKVLPRLGVPVLVVHGLNDTIVPVTHGKHLAKALRCGDSLFVNGEDHESLFRNQVDTIVKRFDAVVRKCAPAPVSTFAATEPKSETDADELDIIEPTSPLT